MKQLYNKEIERLYLQMFSMLFEYARSVLPNDALAEEAVQDTFRIACQKPESLCASPNPEGWLVNTLKNVIQNMERRRRAAEKVVTDCLGDKLDVLPAQADQLDIKLLYSDVADTEEFRIMVALGLEGMSMLELAEELGISYSAAKKRAERARKIMQKRIK